MTVATLDVKNLEAKPESTLHKVWFRFTTNKLALVSMIFIILEILMAIFAAQISPWDPNKQDYTAVFQLPFKSAAHILGTDDLGRDVLSRLIFGSRISLSIGILSQIPIVLIGLPLGALAGLMGGWIDYLLMRVIDVLSSIPTYFFYILLILVLGSGFVNIIIAISLTGWIGIARLVRGQVLTLRETDYVRAARAMGASTRQIVTKHLIRNALTPVIISVALGIPGAMFTEAGLSWLGIGISPPTPSWGQFIGLYQMYIQSYWHLTVFPALILAATMLAWIYVGNGIRDALDPSIQI
jgi:ABC-type dipeptide/oligopeptide/nickel transport system permease subunit